MILLCFVITGLCVGLGGLVLTSRVQSGQPNAGGLLALTAIAAIVVGGNNLLGGRGSISRTLWGVLLLAVLENGLQLEGVNDDLQRVVIGACFIAAASVEFFRRRLRRRARAAEEAELVAAADEAPAAAETKRPREGRTRDPERRRSMSAEPAITPFIGRGLSRREDLSLLRGGGKFIDDLSRPRQLHAAFVRSAHAHAVVAPLDGAPAEALPGVVAVYTAEDIRGEIGHGADDLAPARTPRCWSRTRGR